MKKLKTSILMKKLWILLAATAIISCKQEAPVDYALISGKIANADAKEMTLYGSFKHTITIAEDGSFIDTVKVAGQFSLYQARNETPLYLEIGSDIKINFDAKDFENTLTLSGKGSETSSYLVAKNNKEKELTIPRPEIYTKEEADYKKYFNKIKTAQEDLLMAASGVSEDFKAKEKRNLNYTYLEELNTYKSAYSYFSKKEDFEPSKEFLSELETIAYDSEEDFKFSKAYKSLVNSHYKNIISEMKKTDDTIDSDIEMLKLCRTIKNQTIKNAIIYKASNYSILLTENLEVFYTAYKAAKSTDAKNNAKKKKVPTATLR